MVTLGAYVPFSHRKGAGFGGGQLMNDWEIQAAWGGGGKSRFTAVSTCNRVYSCVVTYPFLYSFPYNAL